MPSPAETVERDRREVWSVNGSGAVGRVVAEDFTLHDLSGVEPITGPDRYLAYVETYHEGFPDLRARVERTVVADDHVFVWTVLEGTHEGSFGGVPATDERVSVRLPATVRTRDGRQVSAWTPGWRSVARELLDPRRRDGVGTGDDDENGTSDPPTAGGPVDGRGP